MKNIQIIDGAMNATFSLFQATTEEFLLIFPDPEQDMEVFEDFIKREPAASSVLEKIWNRPVLKRDAAGVHGTLFFDYESRREFLPVTKREMDWDPSHLNTAQRVLFAKARK